MPTFNGFKNYETWNIILWFRNDLILNACIIGLSFKGIKNPFLYLRQELKESTFNYIKTSDGVSLFDARLDISELNDEIKEITQEKNYKCSYCGNGDYHTIDCKTPMTIIRN